MTHKSNATVALNKVLTNPKFIRERIKNFRKRFKKFIKKNNDPYYDERFKDAYRPYQEISSFERDFFQGVEEFFNDSDIDFHIVTDNVIYVSDI